MFLKRIEIQGFKSFADRIAIDFESPFTGVVGPNGCGKSNIVDAIRWVLGEQSIKSLRGEKMTDIIFAGSADRKAQNMAEVTLAFDNHEHYLNTESDEVEITRRIYNTEQDAEYLINRQQVRLKDVIDLILDTGLGKDSLSIISQGNIQSFAEARPYERRGIFEDAAGVSKYKKRKGESLSRLERTKLNLDRTYDILQELERQVIPLERQAKKAIKYRENKKRLTEIEVAVLVDDIAYYQKAKAEVEEKIAICENNVTLSEGTVQIQENAMADDKSRLHELDKEIADLQDRHFKVVNEIQSLEKRKVEFDEKRKYLIESGSDDDKINALNELIASSKLEYEDRLNRLDKLNNELSLISNELEDTAFALSDATLKKEEAAANLRRLENRLDLLTNLLKDPFSSRSQAGVGAIMQNKESLNGILGVVGQELHPLPNYASALSVALGGAMYNIVTEDEKAAREEESPKCCCRSFTYM